MINLVIEFEIDNPKLISVNEQYMHPVRKTKRGRYTSYVCKSPYLKEVQEFYKEVLSEKISDDDVEDLQSEVSSGGGNVGVELTIRVGLPRKDIYEYDISNFIKSLEDCIVARIKIDDSRNLKVSISKNLFESESEDWKLYVKISTTSLLNFDSVAEEE